MTDARYKRCGKCNEVKPISGFHRDRRQADGHHPFCRPCVNAYWRDQRARRAKGERGAPGLRTFLTEKKCAECGETKPIDDFYRDRSHRGGADRMCKPCRRARTAAAKAGAARHFGRKGPPASGAAQARELSPEPAPPPPQPQQRVGYVERFIDERLPMPQDRRPMKGYGGG